MTTLFDGRLFADYFQFYVANSGVAQAETLPWTDDDLRQRLQLEAWAVVVRAARNMEVPVRVELHRAAVDPEIHGADHIVEAPLFTAGEVVIAGCTDYWPDAALARVPSGNLRVLIPTRLEVDT